ncbi:MAG: DUF5979 domain-containing protein [Candidatus Nanopelagicales bacterium]
MTNYIDAIRLPAEQSGNDGDAGGGTNWDQGIYQVAQSNEKYDVAIVLTDGSPTYYGKPAAGPGGSTNFRTVEEAVFSANALKAKSTRVIGFGVGSGVSNGGANLQAISGTAINSDYYQTSDYVAAGNALRDLALGSCKGSISVVKKIVPWDAPAGTTNGATLATTPWTFGATTTTSGVTIDPASTQTDTTTGAASFNLTFPGTTSTAAVTLQETQQAGYTLQQVGGKNAECVQVGTNPPVTVGVTDVGATGFTAEANKSYPVSCTVYNRQPSPTGSLKILKTVSNPDGATLDPNYAYPIQYKCGTNGTWTDAAVKAGGNTVINGIPTGTSCQVREGTIAGSQTPADFTWSTPTFSPSDTVTITPKDATIEVTVANTITRDKGQLKILKTVSNPDGATLDPNYAYPIQYKCGTNGTWTDAAVKAGGNTVINGIPTGTSCQVREGTIAGSQTPADFTWSTPTFSPSDTVTITPKDATIEVTVANTITRDKGQLKILKTVSNPDGATLDPNYAYPIQYKCGTNGTWTDAAVKAGGNTVINGIPTGTSCQVREGTIAGSQTPADFTWSTPTFSPSDTVTITPKDATIEVTVANTITRDKGKLKILKTVSNPDGATLDPNYAYPIQYKCGTNGAWTDAAVKAGGNTVINGIPTGTSCQVREGTIAGSQTPADFTWSTPTFSPSDTVTITPKDATIEVTVANTITRDKGKLKILKTVSNPDGATLDPNYAYPIQYKCGTNGAWTDAAVKAGGNTVINGIPTGTSCQVREGTIAGSQTPADFTWSTPTFSPSDTVTITPKDATIEVTVANTITRDKGQLKILKTVSNPDGATLDPNYAYPIQYKCGTNGTWTDAAVKAGGNTVINGIPTGTSCQVREGTIAGSQTPADFTWSTPTFSPSDTVTITPKDATIEVTVANTITRDKGQLKILKTVSNPDGATLDPNYAYPIQYKCGTNGTWTDAAVKAGGNTVINGIPTGTSCQVREGTIAGSQTPADFTWSTPTFSPSDTVTITPKDATIEVTVANTITRDKGQLKILKTVSNPDGATLDPNYAYPIQYKCGTNGAWTDAAVKAGGNTVINGIPTGTSCQVREGTIAGSQTPADFTWSTPTFSPSDTVTITPKDATIEVTVANTITRDKGKLKILKTVSNPDGATLDPNYAYPIQYKCGTNGAWTDAAVKAGGNTVINGIPTGTSCQVREGTIAGSQTPADFTWSTPTFSPSDTVTITPKDATIEVTVANTITRDKGKLKILKTVSNPDGATLDPNYAYPIQYKCGTNGATGPTRPSRPADNTVINGIPTGTSCQVREGTIAGSQTPAELHLVDADVLHRRTRSRSPRRTPRSR